MSHLIILAAGKGTRLKSRTSKVLTSVKGVPLILRLLENVKPFSANPTIVIGHKSEDVIGTTGGRYHYVLQKELKGTGHALASALEYLDGIKDDTLLVVYGDHPLISALTLENLLNAQTRSGAVIALGTLTVPHFDGLYEPVNHYGRIIRNKDGGILDIKEFKDADQTERLIKEVNPGFYCFDRAWLTRNISKLENNNAAAEFYLTDIVKIALAEGEKVVTQEVLSFEEALGINTPDDLDLVESILEKKEKRGEHR